MTEKRPSSVRLGSRPSALRIRSYSSTVRLCWASSSGDTVAMRNLSPGPGSPQLATHVGAADIGLAGRARDELLPRAAGHGTDAAGGVSAEGPDPGLAVRDGIGDHREGVRARRGDALGGRRSRPTLQLVGVTRARSRAQA